MSRRPIPGPSVSAGLPPEAVITTGTVSVGKNEKFGNSEQAPSFYFLKSAPNAEFVHNVHDVLAHPAPGDGFEIDLFGN